MSGTPRSLKKSWAAAMVELLSEPVNEARVRKVLRILGSENHKQEVLDV
jgi:hypothetical protein